MPEPGMSIAKTENSLIKQTLLQHLKNINQNRRTDHIYVCRKITPNFIKISLLQVNASPTSTLQQLCLITDTLHSKLQ